MTQMYRVKFARKLSVDTVDLGDVIVCAGSQEQAGDFVAQLYGLGSSAVEWDISRVKPSLYQVSRREVHNSLSTAMATTVNAAYASCATFPGVTENQPDEFWFEVQITARIRAEHEHRAALKLSQAVAREMTGEPQKSSCKELDIRCDRTEYHAKQPAMERQAIYTDVRFVPGGAGRPR
jgi:hypothetical protein